MTFAPLLAWLAFSAAAPAAADLVELQNGVRLEGIVREGGSKGVVLQVASDGFVFLDEAEVVRVDRGGAKESERLRGAWREEERRAREAEKREREEERFLQGQREKGLVYRDGRWLTPGQELERLEAERAELENAELRRGPPPVQEPAAVKVAWGQEVFLWSLGAGRRRGPHRFRGARPAPSMTSSGLLPQPFSIPREVPLNQGIPHCRSIGGAGCPPLRAHP